jgi:hypothetical protein
LYFNEMLLPSTFGLSPKDAFGSAPRGQLRHCGFVFAVPASDGAGQRLGAGRIGTERLVGSLHEVANAAERVICPNEQWRVSLTSLRQTRSRVRRSRFLLSTWSRKISMRVPPLL